MHESIDTELPDPSDIELEELGQIDPRRKIAYCFSTTSWTLLISNSGHGKILRGRDKREYDCGGWADISGQRLWETNGTVGNVPEAWREVIRSVLERRFRTDFRWPHGE